MIFSIGRSFTSLTFSRIPVHWESWSGGTPRGTLPGTSPGSLSGREPGILLEPAWLCLGRVWGLEPLSCLELDRLWGGSMMNKMSTWWYDDDDDDVDTTILRILNTDAFDYCEINLGLIGEQGGETERRGPGRDPAGEGGTWRWWWLWWCSCWWWWWYLAEVGVEEVVPTRFCDSNLQKLILWHSHNNHNHHCHLNYHHLNLRKSSSEWNKFQKVENVLGETGGHRDRGDWNVLKTETMTHQVT